MNSGVLVTGASGLVGRALMAALRQAGREAVGWSSAEVDLRDWAATRAAMAALRPALVFHLAARVRGIMGNRGVQGEAYRDNIQIGTHLVEAARLAGTRKIVAMGSAAVYGDSVPLPMQESAVWTGPPHPAEAGYAHAKRALLAQLETYRDQWGLAYAYCIATNMYGPHDRFDERHGHVIPSLVSKFHRAATQGGAVEVWGSGAPLRDFLHAGDAAQALLLIAERGEGAINLASGRAVPIREAVTLIAAIAGFRGPVRWDPDKPDGQRLRGYDLSRLTALGFAPRWTLRDGLADTYAWYAAHQATARR